MKKLLTLVIYIFCMMPSNAQGTWQRQAPLPYPDFDYEDIAWATRNRGYITGTPVYDTLSVPTRVMETTDGGVSWHELILNPNEITINAVFFLDSLHGWMVGNINYRTLDGGNTWTEMPGMCCSFAAVEFLDINFGWAASTGALSITHNGGLSWNFVGLGNGDYNNASFLNSNIGIAWTFIDGKLDRTTNGGLTWTTVYAPGGVWDARFVNNNVVIAGAETGILRSVDAGLTWTQALAGTWPTWTYPKILQISATNLVAYTVQGTVYYSSDMGLTWTLANFPSTLGLYNGFKINNTQAVLLSAEGELIRTTDGGINWNVVSPKSGYPLFAAARQSGNQLWAVGSAGLIMNSFDNGATWDFASSGLSVVMRDVKFFDDQHGVAVGEFGTILVTNNGGQKWEPQRIGTDLQAISIINKDTAVIAGEYTIAYTTDQGATWAEMPNIPSVMLTLYYDVHFVTLDEGWVCTQFQTIWHTTDRGQTWTNQHGIFAGDFYGLEFVDNQQGWVVGPQSLIERTTDGGNTWNVIPINPPSPGFIFDIDFIDAQKGWMCGDNGFMAKSVDGGLTWTVVNVPLVERFMDLEMVTHQEVYATGIFGHVLHTTDGGLTWTVEQPMPSIASGLHFSRWDGLAVRPNAGIWVAGFELFHKSIGTSACLPPDNLLSTVLSPESVTLSWSAVNGAASYELRGRAAGGAWIYFNTTSNQNTFNNLSNSFTYEWQVRTLCLNNDTSTWSSIESFQTFCNDAGPISSTNITSTSVLLNWNSVSSALGYRIRGRVLGNPAIIQLDVAGSAVNQFLVSGLTPSTGYEWEVLTVCNSSNGLLFSSSSGLDTFYTAANKFIPGVNSEDDQQFRDLRIYPNPVSDYAVVIIPGYFEHGEQSTLYLFDLNGKEVSSRDQINSERVHFSTAALTAGTYIMVYQRDAVVYRKKIIIH